MEVVHLLELLTLTLRPWQPYKVASMSQRNIFKETNWHLTLANNKIFQGFQYVKTFWWTRSAAVARITDTDTLALATLQGCLQSAFCCRSVFKCTFYWFAMFGCKQYHQYCLKIWSIVKPMSCFLKQKFWCWVQTCYISPLVMMYFFVISWTTDDLRTTSNRFVFFLSIDQVA